MNWSPHQARNTLLLFLLIFIAGQFKAYLTRPVYPGPMSVPGAWPPAGHLIDATTLDGESLMVFPRGVTVLAAMDEIGIAVDPLGSGFCLPRAGKLVKGQNGWKIRPMSQQERWVWRIPMDLYRCEPGDLKRINGIGPVLAARIYRHVQLNGCLESISDLDDVPGVGPRKLKSLIKELEIP